MGAAVAYFNADSRLLLITKYARVITNISRGEAECLRVVTMYFYSTCRTYNALFSVLRPACIQGRLVDTPLSAAVFRHCDQNIRLRYFPIAIRQFEAPAGWRTLDATPLAGKVMGSLRISDCWRHFNDISERAMAMASSIFSYKVPYWPAANAPALPMISA